SPQPRSHKREAAGVADERRGGQGEPQRSKGRRRGLRANAHIWYVRSHVSAMSKSHARQLREAVRQLMVAHGTFEEAKRPCGTELPMPHAYALLDLLHHGQPMTVSELAARLSIDRTN